MNVLVAKLVAAVVAIVIAFTAGWQVKGAFVAKRDLAIVEAKTEFINAYKDAEKGKADLLEKKLGELRANEKVIERERIKIIDRPIYSQQCLDADGLLLIESARTGKANSIKPISEVPTTH